LSPSPEPDEAEYATLVEEAFIAERGTPFLLSPKDWVLIRGWRERGVPADTVIRAIRETFERRRARGSAGKISSVAYCENAVDERWELERRGLAGKNDGAPAAAMTPASESLARLSDVLAAVRPEAAPGVDGEAVVAALSRAREKVLALPAAAPRDELEDALLAIETSLARAVKRALAPEALAELDARVAADLGEMPGVSAQVVDRTRRALERRELRRLAGAPPLSLF